MTFRVSTSILNMSIRLILVYFYRSHDFLVTRKASKLSKWFHSFSDNYAFFILLIVKSTWK